MTRRRLGTTLTIMVMVFSLIGVGCLGRFAAFNKLSDWNQKATDNKFVNEIIFLALNIVPVYGIALLADAVVFNSIEFWTGENPMMTEGDYKKVVEAGDLKAIQTFRQSGDLKTMVVDYYSHGQLANTLMLSQQAGSPEFNGIVVASNGTVENFRIQAGEASLSITRFNPQGKPTTEVVEGPALQSLSERVAGLINTHTIRLASAH